jgi:hypothetical protein
MEPGQAVHTKSQLTIVINAAVCGMGKPVMQDRLADLFKAHGMEHPQRRDVQNAFGRLSHPERRRKVWGTTKSGVRIGE